MSQLRVVAMFAVSALPFTVVPSCGRNRRTSMEEFAEEFSESPIARAAPSADQIRSAGNAWCGMSPVIFAVALTILWVASVGQAQGQSVKTRVVTREIEQKSADGAVQSEDGGEALVLKTIVFVGDDGEVLELRGEAGSNDAFAWSHDGRVLELGGQSPSFLLQGLGLGSGYLGVELTALTDALRRHFGVGGKEGVGVMIAEIAAGSPAAGAGLAVGDIVTVAGGTEIRSPRDLSRVVRSKSKDDPLDLELWRDGRPLSFTVALGERERPLVKLGVDGSGFRFESLGISDAGEEGSIKFEDAMGQLREYFEGDEWQARLKRFEKEDWTTFEERMAKVQRQLAALEKKLAAMEKDGD
jgi:membrane-associated protease RseP (regulator of RpoE activity)